MLGRSRVESVQFLGGQPDRYDLHRFRSGRDVPAPTLQPIDVVTGFGLVGPLLICSSVAIYLSYNENEASDPHGPWTISDAARCAAKKAGDRGREHDRGDHEA